MLSHSLWSCAYSPWHNLHPANPVMPTFSGTTQHKQQSGRDCSCSCPNAKCCTSVQPFSTYQQGHLCSIALASEHTTALHLPTVNSTLILNDCCYQCHVSCDSLPCSHIFLMCCCCKLHVGHGEMRRWLVSLLVRSHWGFWQTALGVSGALSPLPH